MQQNNDRPRRAGGGHHSAVGAAGGPRQAPPDEAGDLRYTDPWYDELASGWGESAGAPRAQVPAPPARRKPRADADVYLEVQRSAAFQEVRSRYRRFVIPGAAAFFVWYVAYVVTATSAPHLMARPVAGAVNVGMLAGLGQFLTTFLLTWAYTRHARLRRDRAALDLRWEAQELARGRGGAA
ncbi:DUF485 domain-containing protein [Streptomyces sp. H28]|uniref:DUF485 domain-containing protein n=1 Tax=Streptomyces sp. H28 TaxID=2775865 RepID=UPI00177F2C59|nr:DUF485 domain-containing protein [Streptomyces sp. H28]MBD9731986.1 DUF485 domain-containing protein [Streptomyces sp. H28]